MQKILLFYTYTYFKHPKQILKWQRKICDELNLMGRIIVAHEGINGTVSGSIDNIEYYKEIMRKYPQLADVDFKESLASAECFPRMRITVRDEIVRLGVKDAAHIQNTGEHITPDQTHELIKENPDDLVILDTPNNFA